MSTWTCTAAVPLTNMSILHYFKKTLCSAGETEISEVATREVNQRVLDRAGGEPGPSGWRKPYTVYTDEERGWIGRFAAENSNAPALKRFRGDLDLL